MRIAVPSTNGKIPNHLGQCASFLIADVEGGKVVREVELPNPGHHGPGGPPPAFLANQGVTKVLAWGAPPHAHPVFAQLGIAIHLGATGSPREALRAWLEGTLKLTDEALDASGHCDDRGDGHEHDHG